MVDRFDLKDYHPPEGLRYTQEGLWVSHPDPNGIVMIGITDYAADQVGKVLSLSTPLLRSKLTQFKKCGEVELADGSLEIYSPVSGELVGVNDILNNKPELVKKSPYEDAWIFRIRLGYGNTGGIENLLDAEGYANHLRGQEKRAEILKSGV